MNEPISVIERRQKIPKYSKYEQAERSNLVNVEKNKLYEYYICDYCGEPIIVKKKKDEMDGGTVEIPQTLNRYSRLNMALHCRCLNKAVAEIEKYNKEEK